ncbi:MAG TPA: UbiA family prenyltransferase [Thermoanaerobaculia bacterium]|nr:UbiA family prenyltransferase [Thermoanaerobaculia bacterium]
MTVNVFLRLSRASNLPTVWSNAIAGVALGGAVHPLIDGAILAISFSLLYTAGMFLNDYYDREFDREWRPDRPITAGEVSPRTVLLTALSMMAAGLLVAGSMIAVRGTVAAAIPLVVLPAAILLYDARHKKGALYAVVMGSCRALLYVIAALAVGGDDWLLILFASSVLLTYVTSLTVAARKEHFSAPEVASSEVSVAAVPVAHGAIGAGALLIAALIPWLAVSRARTSAARIRTVGLLIAAISLVDASIIASVASPGLALLAVTFGGVALMLQSRVLAS